MMVKTASKVINISCYLWLPQITRVNCLSGDVEQNGYANRRKALLFERQYNCLFRSCMRLSFVHGPPLNSSIIIFHKKYLAEINFENPLAKRKKVKWPIPVWVSLENYTWMTNNRAKWKTKMSTTKLYRNPFAYAGLVLPASDWHRSTWLVSDAFSLNGRELRAHFPVLILENWSGISFGKCKYTSPARHQPPPPSSYSVQWKIENEKRIEFCERQFLCSPTGIFSDEHFVQSAKRFAFRTRTTDGSLNYNNRAHRNNLQHFGFSWLFSLLFFLQFFVCFDHNIVGGCRSLIRNYFFIKRISTKIEMKRKASSG